jgi:hypothetical protein
MFEAVEDGYAGETPARVRSGFLIRVPMDTRKPLFGRAGAGRVSEYRMCRKPGE